MSTQLCYLWHSGVALLLDDLSIVIDYYEDSAGGHAGILHDRILRRGVPLYVLSTHFHHDHYTPEIFAFEAPHLTYILSRDIAEQRGATLSRHAQLHFIARGETFDDGRLRAEAFGSTDEGSSFAVHAGGQCFFHAGDLNNWHWMERRGEREWRTAEARFLAEAEYIRQRLPQCDVVMFPVDPRLGSEYMRGAAQFLDRIRCRFFCPLHFDLAYEQARAFAPCAAEHGATLLDITHRGQLFTLE